MAALLARLSGPAARITRPTVAALHCTFVRAPGILPQCSWRRSLKLPKVARQATLLKPRRTKASDRDTPLPDGMIRTPTGMMSEDDAKALFQEVGFTPPPGMTTQEAFVFLLQEAQKQAAMESGARPPKGRTAKMPTPATLDAATAVMTSQGATVTPITPCGVEVEGVDLAAASGKVSPEVAGALEMQQRFKELANAPRPTGCAA